MFTASKLAATLAQTHVAADFCPQQNRGSAGKCLADVASLFSLYRCLRQAQATALNVQVAEQLQVAEPVEATVEGRSVLLVMLPELAVG
jgi:hypothetical protein